ncbi:hypothetical protein AHAS_Ahas15G0399200 [Arachis hypogaea]
MVAKEMCFFNKIDSLDTLALLGDRDRFATSIEWIGKIFALILDAMIGAVPSYEEPYIKVPRVLSMD